MHGDIRLIPEKIHLEREKQEKSRSTMAPETRPSKPQKTIPGLLTRNIEFGSGLLGDHERKNAVLDYMRVKLARSIEIGSGFLEDHERRNASSDYLKSKLAGSIEKEGKLKERHLRQQLATVAFRQLLSPEKFLTNDDVSQVLHEKELEARYQGGGSLSTEEKQLDN